jgi:uncharacterized protein YbjT (DUF2867 family)
MVGQGVLRECLVASDVEHVISVGRSSTGVTDPRIQQLVLPDLFELVDHETELSGYDACFFCLGVSSAGMDEASYTRMTFDLTLSIAKLLSRLNPRMTFVYVSGVGTDESEKGRSMWARVKGRTENELRKLPFKAAYLFRPAAILPVNGERSKVQALNWFYTATSWLLGPLRGFSGGYVLTTEDVGRAMLNVARIGWDTRVLEPGDIRRASVF